MRFNQNIIIAMKCFHVSSTWILTTWPFTVIWCVCVPCLDIFVRTGPREFEGIFEIKNVVLVSGIWVKHSFLMVDTISARCVYVCVSVAQSRCCLWTLVIGQKDQSKHSENVFNMYDVINVILIMLWLTNTDSQSYHISVICDWVKKKSWETFLCVVTIKRSSVLMSC